MLITLILLLTIVTIHFLDYSRSRPSILGTRYCARGQGGQTRSNCCPRKLPTRTDEIFG